MLFVTQHLYVWLVVLGTPLPPPPPPPLGAVNHVVDHLTLNFFTVFLGILFPHAVAALRSLDYSAWSPEMLQVTCHQSSPGRLAD